ncbi:MAG TPA: type II toxin-antitoxin system Phd/YefM family antitoxin [bacterium]|nr:type II toxin-antitoxin system Phd/YefM family antitoxin [bacterium]
MTIVNMYEAKTHLSKLVQKALSGEDIILAKAGKPLVRLVPANADKKEIKFGLLKGRIQIADDFNDFGPEMKDIFKNHL